MSARMWGIGVYHPKTAENVGTLWRAAHLYGASFIYTIGARYRRQASDTTKAWRSIPLLHYTDFDTFNAARPFAAPLVGIELDPRAVALSSFEHPKQAVYLLGAEDHGLPASVIEKCQHIVQIEAAQPWSMNVAMAGSLVAYSRHMQVTARMERAS
jgi:tRNA G18 (ribose-2'-O)-methylase SpoU